MKGKVEVFAVAADGSERLLASEPNLVVDGAGEAIVDMLTCPSSVLGISPRVMDTSNWRWGALSFGPAASSFQENAYFFPSGNDTYNHIYKTRDEAGNVLVSANVTSYINQIGTDKILRPLYVSSDFYPNCTPSSYTPPYRLPSYPDPKDTKLEDASTAYSIVSGDGTQSYGQFENRIMYASGDASSYFQGGYPLSSLSHTGGELSAMLVSSYEGDFSTDPLKFNVDIESPQSSGIIVYGAYNYKATMDYRGFLEVSAGNVNNTYRQEGYAFASGSQPVDLTGVTSQVTVPTAAVTTIIYCSDLWAMNLYGGLHQIGLWSLDCKKSLENQQPPFSPTAPRRGSGGIRPQYISESGVTPREFKLFAKKTFTENMSQVQDVGIMSGFMNSAGANSSDPTKTLDGKDFINLKIIWTLDFRSQTAWYPL